MCIGVDTSSSRCGGRRGSAGGTAASRQSPRDLARPIHTDVDPVEPVTLSSSSSVVAEAADRCRSDEQSDGRRPRAKVIGLVAGNGVVAGCVVAELA